MGEVTSESAPAPRGRPRKLTEDQVVEAAAALISDEGFAALSTRSLARRLGVRSSTLYSYFATFDEIADAAVTPLTPARIGGRLLDDITVPDLLVSPAPVEALVALFADLRALLVMHPDAIPARVGSRPWAQMVGMVNALLTQLLALGLSVDRAAACYEALIGVTMSSAAVARTASQTPPAEIEALVRELAPADSDPLLRLEEWANRPADERFRETMRELVQWMLPML